MRLREFILDRRTAHVKRWHHRPVLMEESIATHQALTARIAFFTTILGNQHEVFQLSAERIALIALFHDEPEIITGDFPGDQKQSEKLRTVAKSMEAGAISILGGEAPGNLAGTYAFALAGSGIGEEGRQVLRYADDLAALAFIEDELTMGNAQPSVRATHSAILDGLAALDWPWLVKLRELERIP